MGTCTSVNTAFTSRLTVSSVLMLSKGALKMRRCVARSVMLPLKRYFSVRRSTPTAAMASPPGSLNSGPRPGVDLLHGVLAAVQRHAARRHAFQRGQRLGRLRRQEKGLSSRC
jgi:hypothetical protein